MTHEAHGLGLDDVIRYTDERVQQVYDAMCANAIMQSMNRIRPQLYENKEIFELTAEPIAAPKTPILFTIPDWHAWIDSDRDTSFDVFLQTRESRTVREISEQDCVSERQARRKTETQRKQNKTERNAEIIRLSNDSHRYSDIARHCNVSLRTVKNVLSEGEEKCRNGHSASTYS